MRKVALKATDRRDDDGKDNRLHKSAGNVFHFDARLNSVEVSSIIKSQQHHTANVPTDDADNVEQGCQERKADDGSSNPRADQIAERVDAHGIKSIDLLGD